MHNILHDIAAATRIRVAAQKELVSARELHRHAVEVRRSAAEARRSAAEARKRVEAYERVEACGHAEARERFVPPVLSFADALAKPGLSFICEIKRASPSKGIIAEEFNYLDIAHEYELAGTDALSVLTEPDFFKGSSEYLRDIAAVSSLPVLCKDFVIDRYQIDEACVLGASAVLLICALLDDRQLKGFLEYALRLDLNVLVEAHNEEEVVRALQAGARIIGVNNRDLRSFETDFDTTLRLRSLVPPEILFVSESGINTPDNITRLCQANIDAVLIGESMMRAIDKAAFLNTLRGGSL